MTEILRHVAFGVYGSMDDAGGFAGIIRVDLLSHLVKLRAKHGVIAIMGNHDGWHMEGLKLKRAFEKSGITFLFNETTPHVSFFVSDYGILSIR